MHFKNIPLRFKLALATGAPTVFLVILAFIAITSSRSQVQTNAMVDHTHNVVQQAMKIEAAAVDMETGMRGFLLAGKEEFLEPYNNGLQRFSQLASQLKLTVSDNPVQVERLGNIEATIEAWRKNITQPFIELRRDVGDAKTMNDMANLVGQARGKVYFDKFRGQIKEFIHMEDELMIKRQFAANLAAEKAQNTFIIGTLIAITLGFLISSLVHRAITRPVNQVAVGLESLAKGDLTNTIEIDSKDELGAMAASYNQAVEKTNTAILEVLRTTDEVVDGSIAITQANRSMSLELGEQSEKIAHISLSIEQISQSIQEVASKSSEATANAQEAGVTANTGGNIVQSTIQGMSSINEAVTASSTSVTELGRRGAEIGEIINVINEIAEQTNLLALNAAIEAARAGEAGRGFAVVADEVRALADRTTTATHEIGQSIESIQNETSLAVERMETGAAHVSEGLSLVRKAGNSLEEIVDGAESVANMIDSIAAAAEEQSVASGEVSKNVESVSAVSIMANEQANIAASSAKTLETKAQALRNLVNQFKVG